MPSSSITIRLSADDKGLISSYAKAFGQSVSDFIREAALSRIEDELDLRVWDQAKAEYDANPLSYPAEEMAKKYL
ncbi:MAG: DUF1778 domain-containing protein [Coriobacteriales bacterium]|jgi:uncharacterized protein (DUF1778 family)|nr:DUF1778 domain-containing protein [Coriobacteriales bacterium]